MKNFTFLLLLISLHSFAQKQANIWYFGNGAGLDFNNACNPVVLTNGSINGFEGCSTISDKNTGQLLFYTNSEEVWNRNHILMPNSTLVNSGNTITQVVIIEKPSSDSLYYIITSEIQSYSGEGLRFHQIDMSLNGGFGGIAFKDSILYPSPVTEKITAVRHANGTDIWILGHEYNSNNYLAFLVTAAGIQTTPVISSIGKVHHDNLTFDNIGELKASPDRSKLAAVTLNGPNIELFDFDNATGIISNLITLPEKGGYDSLGNSSGLYGVSFSSSNRFLYVSKWENQFLGSLGQIIQYDITSNDSAIINNSRVDVFTTSSKNLYSLQLAPDRKIYVGQQTNNGYIGVINFPDSAGMSCNYVDNGVYLNGKMSGWGLNNLMEYGNYCSAVAANFASSDTLVCEKSCLDFYDMSTNVPTSWQWFFPNAQPDTSTLQNPVGICFNSYGTFDVTLIACNANGCDTISLPGFITIFQNPSQPVVTYFNDTLYCTGPAASYQWYFNSMVIPGATDSMLTNLQLGSYYCLIADGNGCSVSSNVFDVTGIRAVDFNNQWITYTNPVNSSLNIHFNIPLSNATFILYDISGRMLYEKPVINNTSAEMSIDLSAFSSGNYFLKISTGQENFFSKVEIIR
jgi:hypothetical protein